MRTVGESADHGEKRLVEAEVKDGGKLEVSRPGPNLVSVAADFAPTTPGGPRPLP